MNAYLNLIENGKIETYVMNDRETWSIGRPTKDNKPDISLYAETVSRQHGVFQNVEGIWFYIDRYGTNGTFYNHKHISPGFNGRLKPIILNHGDVLVFGANETAENNNCDPVWAMYSMKPQETEWRVCDTKGVTEYCFTAEQESHTLKSPPKGTIVELKKGMAICMGDITYLNGDICLKKMYNEENVI